MANKKLNKKNEDFLKNYFSKTSFLEIKKILLQEINQNQTTDSNLNFDNYLFANRVVIDLLVTKANELDDNKKFDFLITFADRIKNTATPQIAIDIYNKIIKNTSKVSGLGNYTAYSELSKGELYSNQAYWKESKQCIERAKKIFTKERDQIGKIRCENLLGTIYGDQGNLSRARDQFKKSLELIGKLRIPHLKGVVEMNIGIVEYAEGDYEKSQLNLQSALRKFEKIEDNRRISEIRYNIGLMYIKQGEFSKGLKELEKSIKSAQKIEHVTNLGINYLSKSNVFAEQSDYPMAEALSDQAMEISQRINDRLTIADIYRVKGIIERKQKRMESSEEYLKTSLRLNRELENKYNEAETSYELSLLYNDWNKKSQAKKYYDAAQIASKKLKLNLEFSKINSIIN